MEKFKKGTRVLIRNRERGTNELGVVESFQTRRSQVFYNVQLERGSLLTDITTNPDISTWFYIQKSI